ncbi:hypothetical protein N2603_20260 [Bradyrhizobium huanghuaihaiense]|uniref:hypothetical protein n=1 Tax=Bradyrhizobium huanghuaihaiense TaxID=990078 RepID=UPI0021AAE494|nr:hypothetical protein [Bradyrhizobium sp. CB3035]UWU80709.1 hypothetical protein N2603_20260 [Bradyrhizobium sp. CB3035]
MTNRANRATRETIPHDFPHPARLGGRDLFIEVLGNPSITSFNRWLAAGKIPLPRKLGHLNRWLETEMVAVRDAGFEQ